MKKESPANPPAAPAKHQKREDTDQPKKTKIRIPPRQLSSAELDEIAKRMVSTDNPMRAAKLKSKYLEGFYGKRLKDVRRIQRKSKQ